MILVEDDRYESTEDLFESLHIGQSNSFWASGQTLQSCCVDKLMRGITYTFVDVALLFD